MSSSPIAEQIIRMVHRTPEGLRAGEIASAIGVSRRTVNAILHRLSPQRVRQDATSHRWTTTRTSTATGSDRARPPRAGSEPVRVTAYFAPEDEPITHVVRAIDAARTQVVIQAFYLDSDRLSTALLRAHRRGVAIRLLLGKTATSRRNGMDDRHDGNRHQAVIDLHRAGITIHEDRGERVNHNKLVLVDEQLTITGGLNLSDRAEENADNLVFITSRDLTRQYLRNWEQNVRRFGERFTGYRADV